MQNTIQQIETIVGVKLHPAPVRNGDPLAAVMPFKEDPKTQKAVPKYALDDAGNVIGLNLARTGLTDEKWAKIIALPQVAGHLRKLNLCENKLENFAADEKLLNLKDLHLAENTQLFSFGFDTPLNNLERLTLSECQLEMVSIPEGLTSLKHLDLGRNQLNELILNGCPALEVLNLGRNKLKTFTFPTGMYGLKYLYLNNNELQSLAIVGVPRNLTLLDLRQNKLKTLPLELPSFSSLQALYVHENEFEGSIASSVPSGKDENARKQVIDFLSGLQDAIENERVKIIIVGNGRVGKTSMFKRLKNLGFNPNEKPTKGIQIGELKKTDLPDVQMERLLASVWDFGGQEIFYASHQFFLAEEALYILAWTLEENVIEHRERDKDILPEEEKWREEGYWLENIRLHSEKSPILMVQTHFDKKKGSVKGEYQEDPFKAEFLTFSAANNEGIIGLRQAITEKLQQLPHLGDKIPKTWDQVTGEVEKIRRQNKISLLEFNVICSSAKVEKGAEDSVLRFLRNVGSVVWLDKHPTLKEVVFINPNWLTEQVYLLIDKELEKKGGRMDAAWIAQKLRGLSPQDRENLLSLLEEFKLIFKAQGEDSGQYISPQYLPKNLDLNTQKVFNRDKKRLEPVAFRFRFTRFIPDNVLINFLSEYGPCSNNVFWKNGIFFTLESPEFGEVDGIVEFDEKEKTFEVYAPQIPGGLDLQRTVCHKFVELSKLAKIEVALKDTPFVDWKELSDAWEEEDAKIRGTDIGRTYVYVQDFAHLLTKQTMEGGPIQIKEPQKPTIFFSYATGDEHEEGESREKIVDELYSCLEAEGKYLLKRDKKDIHYRKSIKSFMKAMGKGEFIVVVISEKYLKSPLCMFELLEIYKRSNSDMDEFIEKIFPIVLDDAKIRDHNERVQYREFWTERVESLDYLIKIGGIKAVQAIGEDIHIWEEIKNNISNLVNIIREINVSNPQNLAQNNFEIIKAAIEERASRIEKGQ